MGLSAWLGWGRLRDEVTLGLGFKDGEDMTCGKAFQAEGKVWWAWEGILGCFILSSYSTMAIDKYRRDNKVKNPTILQR